MRVSPALTAAGAILAASLLFASASHASDGKPANVANGKAVYQTYCIQCHGVNGDGKGINAPHLSVQPRNHTDRTEMSARTDEDLSKAIKEGGQAVNKSILMPNWDANLSDREIRDVIAYLRKLCCE